MYAKIWNKFWLEVSEYKVLIYICRYFLPQYHNKMAQLFFIYITKKKMNSFQFWGDEYKPAAVAIKIMLQ